MSLGELYPLIERHIQLVQASTNKLALACVYSLQTFSERDSIYIRVIRTLADMYGYSGDDLDYLIVAAYCVLASYQTIYDMPHMRRRRFRDHKICTHVIFGEALAYLTSLTLLSEAQRIFSGISSKEATIQLLEMMHTDMHEFQRTSQVVATFHEIPNTALEQDYTNIQRMLLANVIKSVVILCGYPLPGSDVLEQVCHALRVEGNPSEYMHILSKLYNRNGG